MRQVGVYTPWINTTTYSTPVYTVGADQPKVPVWLDTPNGVVVRDHADDSIVFYGEDPAPIGAHPYRDIIGLRPDRLLKRFPWSDLQALPPGN